MVVRPWIWLPLGMALGIAPAAHGGAREVVVTPGNIGDQRLMLRVEADTLESGSVAFHVSVGAGSDSIFSKHRGRLEIGEWTTIRRSNRVNALVGPKMWCNLFEEVAEGTIHFSFALPEEWLDHARFEFQNSPGGIVEDIYLLPLKEFVVPHYRLPNSVLQPSAPREGHR